MRLFAPTVRISSVWSYRLALPHASEQPNLPYRVEKDRQVQFSGFLLQYEPARVFRKRLNIPDSVTLAVFKAAG